MKQKLLLLIGLSSAIYATQEISCVDFVNMSKAQAKAYIDNYRKEFELNHFKTKNHTKVDKQYIGMQDGVSKHLLTCIDLRRVTYYDVEDVRRALILESLSKKTLNQQEDAIYKKSLEENIKFYKDFSKSSIKNVQYMPLVFLTVQRSNQYYIIYEFRKNGIEIKRYTKKILISKPYIKFSNINEISNQNYLSYLRRQYPNIKLYKEKREANYQINSYQNNLNDKYKVIASIKAIPKGGNSNDSIDIRPNHILTKIRENNQYIYVIDENNDEYHIAKKWWSVGTKKIGVEQ